MATARHENSKRLFSRIVVVIGVFLILNVATWLWGDCYVRLLLPVYQWSFETLTPYYKVQSLRLEQQNNEPIIRVHAQTQGSRQLAGQRVWDGVSVSSSTLAGHALQHVIILFTAIILLPVQTRWERPALIALTIPVLIFVEVLDVPLVLAGALEDLVLYNIDPKQLSSSFLVQGMHFMNSGGRLALSLIAPAIVILTLWTVNKHIRRTK